MSWQPIETAPKGVVDILLFGSCIKDSCAFPPDANVGWWCDGEWVTRCPNETIVPTHWMPLPPPPQASEAGGPPPLTDEEDQDFINRSW